MDSTIDSKKILTKGALKIFEGIKVSIPTEEINLEALNSTKNEEEAATTSVEDLKLYKNGVEVSKTALTAKPVKKRKRPNYIKTIFTKRRTKVVKRKKVGKVVNEKKIQPTAKAVAKTKDVYDFEESQDEFLDDFKGIKDFRDKKGAEEVDSESDHHDYLDAFSLDESSNCSEAEKGLGNENKKTMIMGRIFKHVVKPGAKDVNTLFDTLLPPKTEETDDKKKGKKKKKDGSSDDEFCVKSQKKESSSGINLEQEIRECIGVAGRKSQRKCTSGKQNILVEFWSSDEQSDVDKKAEPGVLKENLQKPKRAVRRKVTNRKNRTKVRRKVGGGSAKDVGVAVSRRKRSASEKLYYWSSSSDDELEDLIEVKPVREEEPDDDDRPMHHGWIVGDSPKKLVTMLAHAKGNKKVDAVYVKEQVKRNRAAL